LSETVLLTGGTGFLGSHLAHELVKNNYSVIIAKRSSSNTWRLDDILEEIACYDIDKTGLEAAFSDRHIDVVIHAACCYGRNHEPASVVVDTNVLFGLRVFECAELYKADTFMNTGTLLPEKLNSYSLSKQQFVTWLQKAAGKVQAITMRPEHMYGPKDDPAKFVSWVIAQLDSDQKEISLTSGTQERDFVHVADVARACLYAVKHRSELKDYNEFEVGTGHSIMVREFISELDRQYKKQRPENQTRLNFGGVPYREGEMMRMKTDIGPLTALGWKPVFGFKEGIETIIPPPPRRFSIN
jgi:nucleoside-diphosphate-sugar epimerase